MADVGRVRSATCRESIWGADPGTGCRGDQKEPPEAPHCGSRNPKMEFSEQEYEARYKHFDKMMLFGTAAGTAVQSMRSRTKARAARLADQGTS